GGGGGGGGSRFALGHGVIGAGGLEPFLARGQLPAEPFGEAMGLGGGDAKDRQAALGSIDAKERRLVGVERADLGVLDEGAAPPKLLARKQLLATRPAGILLE